MDMALYTTGLGTIRKSRIEELEIPIPSIKKQKEIINYCDNLNNMIENIKKQQINNKNLMYFLLVKLHSNY